MNYIKKAERADIDIGEKITTVLGAMCLGCPNNTVTSVSAEEIP